MTSGLVGAARLAWRSPGLWSLGLLGFLARGGLVVILVPMLAIPSPVGLSVLVGADLVDANGLSARVLALLLTAGAVIGALVVFALVLAALADLGAFEGLLDLAGVTIQPLGRAARARLVAQLVVLQVLAVVPAALAAVPATLVVVDVTRAEILLPSSQTTPLWARVAEGAWGGLVAVGLLVVAAGYAYGWLSRELLAQRCGIVERAGWRRTLAGAVALGLIAAVRRPWRALLATVVGWALEVGAIGVAFVAVSAGWTLVQVAFLDPVLAAAPAAPLAVIAAGLAGAGSTVLLVALLGLVLIVLAVVAAMRAAILTRAMLQPAPTAEGGWR